jgi:hypothetical protein
VVAAVSRPAEPDRKEYTMTEPNTDRAGDRLAIAEALYDYAEAMDILGATPIPQGADDPGMRRALPVLHRCLATDVKVRLHFEGPDAPGVAAGDGGPESFGRFVRGYFTDYGYIQTYHLVGNVRVSFTGPDTADVRSYINSNHWMADGRFLSAPIDYADTVVRGADGRWRIADRAILVWKWWVADGYFPVPTDPSLARPAASAD